MMTFGLNRPVYSFGLLAPGYIINYSGLLCWEPVKYVEPPTVVLEMAEVLADTRVYTPRFENRTKIVVIDRTVMETFNRIFTVYPERPLLAKVVDTPEIAVELQEVDKDCKDDI
jgi:hypothetical protein